MTPSEIAALAACFSCIPNRQAAILFLLAQIADVTLEEIIAGSSCMRCVPDFQSAELFLLNEIVTNGTGGGGVSDAVTCGVGAPVTVPASGCGVYIDTSNDALYIYRSGAWVLKA